jgi:hypothetical protein
VYYSGVDNEKELWDRLDGEPSRAYEAFQTFVSLPSGERTMVTAYRQFVGNPNASKVSDAWNEWARRYAWKQRTRAYDAHIDQIRRSAMEKAIEEEAAEQARQAERARNHLNELMDVGYLRSVEFLEELDPSSMRFSDVAQVIRLHLDAVEKLDSRDEGRQEDDWTETDD